MDAIELKEIAHDSAEYAAEIALRHSVLRRPLGLSFSLDQLRAEADSHHIGCFVGGELVGCLVLEPLDARRIQMRQVAVSEVRQGAGLGRLMVNHSEAFARKLGYQEVVLHARETVVPFYEKLGYTRVGDRFTEVTLPHWAMVKSL